MEPQESAPHRVRKRVRKKIRIKKRKKKSFFSRITKLNKRAADIVAIIMLILFVISLYVMLVYRGPSANPRTKKKIIRDITQLDNFRSTQPPAAEYGSGAAALS